MLNSLKTKRQKQVLSSSSLPTYTREHPGINIVVDLNANQLNFAEVTSGGITTNHIVEDPTLHQDAQELQQIQNNDRGGVNSDEEVCLAVLRGRSRVRSEKNTKTTTHLL